LDVVIAFRTDDFNIMPGVAQITSATSVRVSFNWPFEWANFFAPLIIRMLLIFYPSGFEFVTDFTPRSGAVK
jgi:hypothetical protein